MPLNHGINTYKSDTDFISVTVGTVGIPFFIGAWPAHTGGGYTGKPQIANSFEEAKALGGYSEDWRDASGNPKWTLCQAMYSHFKVFAMTPAVFFNVFDPATNVKSVAEASKTVTDHMIKLPLEAINDTNLTVKKGETACTKGTDYDVYYDDKNLIIELISTGSVYSETSLLVAYKEADFTTITSSAIEAAVDKIDQCMALFGLVPDLICAPGWSQTASVAAVMAAKAAAVNGLFKCKAVVDLDTSSSGADTYDDVKTYKETNGYTSENMIVCWPLVKVGSLLFDYSVILCGLTASIDAENDGVPYESPSNKALPITACVTKGGTEVNIDIQQADTVSITAGVVTALNFNGWVCWGNYTGTSSGDVAKKFICTNRMMDFLCNTFVVTFWSYLDQPLTRVLIDAIVNSYNSYLNGLTSEGMLLGGEIDYVEDNNSVDDLIAGKFRLDTKAASPVPAQRIDMFVEYGVEMLTAALVGEE